MVAIAPSSLSKRIRKYPLVKIVVEAKEVGRWSFRHSGRALNEALPPNVRPITVLRAFFAGAPCISITISVGNSASNSILKSTGDGPWGSAPVGRSWSIAWMLLQSHPSPEDQILIQRLQLKDLVVDLHSRRRHHRIPFCNNPRGWREQDLHVPCCDETESW